MTKRFNDITRNKADAAFSKYIRTRDGYQCRRCNIQFAPGNAQNLHCSHHYGRGDLSVRYHPDNAIALCRDCHNWFTFNKPDGIKWLNDLLSKQQKQNLMDAMEANIKPDMAKGSRDINALANYYNALAGISQMQTETFRRTLQKDLNKMEEQTNIRRGEKSNLNSIRRAEEREMLERLLNTYRQMPKDSLHKKSYRRQIQALMQKLADENNMPVIPDYRQHKERPNGI